MSEPFGTYVDDEQRQGLAEALTRKGYEVSTREHGGWGGGTEWVVRRWKTRHHVLLGLVLPALLCVSSLFSAGVREFVIAMAPSLVLLVVFGLPTFTATFTWWDSPSEDEWQSSYAGSDKEYAEVVAVVEETSGRKVHRRHA